MKLLRKLFHKCKNHLKPIWTIKFNEHTLTFYECEICHERFWGCGCINYIGICLTTSPVRLVPLKNFCNSWLKGEVDISQHTINNIFLELGQRTCEMWRINIILGDN